MLQVVYDASPLVRAEVAVSLARVAAGHTLYIQVFFTTLQVLWSHDAAWEEIEAYATAYPHAGLQHLQSHSLP